MKKLVFLTLFLTACGAQINYGKHGPFEVFLGDEKTIRETCQKLLVNYDPRVKGCVSKNYIEDKFKIYCEYGDADCLAHEFRHIWEPEWIHPH